MKHAVAGLLAFLVATGATVVTMETGLLATAESQGLRPRFSELPTASALPADDVLAGVDAPTWRVGYAWAVVFGEGTGACMLAVVEATADGYRTGIECDDDDFAAVQTASTDAPHLGDFDLGLGGAYESEVVEFFSWPLVDGKTWTTRYGPETLEITAHFVPDLEGPFGAEPGYVMEAEFEGGSSTLMTYDYLPSIGWWSFLEFDNALGGWTDIRIVDFGPSWHGRVWTADADELLFSQMSFLPPVQDVFSVRDEHDQIFLMGAANGIHVIDFELVTPGGDVAYRAGSSSLSGQTSTVSARVDAEPGSWELRGKGAGLNNIAFRVWGVTVTEWRI